MTLSRRIKRGVFVLEGMNSFATVCYFYYFYFFMQKEFGFGNKSNLILAAANGLTYALFSWLGGKAASQIGYFRALALGFGTMMSALLIGSQLHSPAGQIVVMLLTVVGMCLTWPVLEAIVSENEDRAGLQHMVGVYNIVWAATGAVAYFIGGAILDAVSLRCIFYVPIGIQAVQVALSLYLGAQARKEMDVSAVTPAPVLDEPHPHSPAKTKVFLRMAWLSNPFAYIAINTVVAVIPGVAAKLNLSTMLAGFCCSVWCFARFGSFVLLWLWGGWHYKFRWLLLAFTALIGSFATILIVPNLAALVVAQLFFGGALGLIYYSSLFYSMDLSETKSEHGGIHEAAIGLGNFAGPAVGAVSLHLVPQYANSGAVAVTLLLVAGMGGLLTIWRTGRV